MSNQTSNQMGYIDKTNWPEGPWMTEPDKVQFITAVGLPALIVRNWMGALCGYVGVHPGHPCYEEGYHVPAVDVHGGLTYSNHCQENGPICHVPAPGEPDDVWWFGFDCAHARDMIPGLSVGLLGQGADVYRDLRYVRAECEELARQLKAMEGPC